MTVKDFYEVYGGNYQEAFGRLMKDERILKYLKMFTQVDDFQEFINNYKNESYEEAFRRVHNLKGMSLNLALAPLANISSIVCEELRHGKPENDISSDIAKLDEEYNRTIKYINLID